VQVSAAVDGALDTAQITDQTLYVEKRKIIDKVGLSNTFDGWIYASMANF
jgi:hypothetical protein